MCYLSKIIKVVFAIHPAKRWPLADTVGFVDDVMSVATLTVVQHALEELRNKNIGDLSISGLQVNALMHVNHRCNTITS